MPAMDGYDAIELVGMRSDEASQMLARLARAAADLWNDPPAFPVQRDAVAEVFPELADVLDELLGGGPCSVPLPDEWVAATTGESPAG